MGDYMEKENIKYNTNERNGRTSTKKRKKKKNKSRKFILLAIILCILIVGIIYFLTTFQSFNIAQVIVTGTERYSVEQLQEKLDIQIGNNIFKEMFLSSKIDYSDLAYIEDIKLRMNSNNKLELKITERNSLYIAFNKDNNKYYRLDENGYILEECDVSSKTETEVVMLGIAFDVEVKIGSKISDVYLSKFDSYLNIKNEYEKTTLKDYGIITKVKFDNSFTTITVNDKLDVILQDNNDLKYKMSLLQGIVEKLSADSVGTIDMTKTNPVYSAY